MRFKEWILSELATIMHGGIFGPRVDDLPVNPESGVMGLSKYIATPPAEPKTGYEKAVGKKTPDKAKRVMGFDRKDRKILAKSQEPDINSWRGRDRNPTPYTN